jgi:hypothetical protein
MAIIHGYFFVPKQKAKIFKKIYEKVIADSVTVIVFDHLDQIIEKNQNFLIF